MREKLSTQPYKGTRDFYPQDMRPRNWFFGVIRNVPETSAFDDYNGPMPESLDIYAAKSGEEIANKQTYNFLDRGGHCCLGALSRKKSRIYGGGIWFENGPHYLKRSKAFGSSQRQTLDRHVARCSCFGGHIEKVYNEMLGGKERYWDQVAFDYFLSEYKIYIRECSFSDVVEIDTFNELKKIDPIYAI